MIKETLIFNKAAVKADKPYKYDKYDYSHSYGGCAADVYSLAFTKLNRSIEEAKKLGFVPGTEVLIAGASNTFIPGKITSFNHMVSRAYISVDDWNEETPSVLVVSVPNQKADEVLSINDVLLADDELDGMSLVTGGC